MKPLFEHNGGTYCKQGDYLILTLTLPKSCGNAVHLFLWLL